MIDRKALLVAAVSKFGNPYLFGAKWDPKNPNPSGPIDCSGFYRWCYGQIGIDIPDGSSNQHAASVTPGMVLPGDAGFLHQPQDINIEHHVGMVYDDYFMIEARGVIVNGQEIGTVCLHLRKEWEKRPDFLGYFRPKAVVAVEGA